MKCGKKKSSDDSQDNLEPEEYFRQNLLGREVLDTDVAEAFLHLALSEKTTGSVFTVDGRIEALYSDGTPVVGFPIESSQTTLGHEPFYGTPAVVAEEKRRTLALAT